jgi:shikimate kinase
MKNIVLIGFMCSGKTTVGRSLAKKLNFDHLDTDQWIRKETNLEIAEIFERKGEDYFRNLETQTVKHFSNELRNTVLSTGGGLPIRKENASYLKKIGTVVYLQVSKETVVSRLNKNIERPLLAVKDPENKISKLLNDRNPLYEQVADITIDTNNKTIDIIVNEILEYL